MVRGTGPAVPQTWEVPLSRHGAAHAQRRIVCCTLTRGACNDHPAICLHPGFHGWHKNTACSTTQASHPTPSYHVGTAGTWPLSPGRCPQSLQYAATSHEDVPVQWQHVCSIVQRQRTCRCQARLAPLRQAGRGGRGRLPPPPPPPPGRPPRHKQPLHIMHCTPEAFWSHTCWPGQMQHHLASIFVTPCRCSSPRSQTHQRLNAMRRPVLQPRTAQVVRRRGLQVADGQLRCNATVDTAPSRLLIPDSLLPAWPLACPAPCSAGTCLRCRPLVRPVMLDS